MIYKVRNVKGSGDSQAPSGYSSWLDYWEKKTGRKARYCHRESCIKTATDGAHVQLVDGGNEWYIVPLCHDCNMSPDEILNVAGPLVPVNPFYPIKW